jgi:uncharacterized protein (TIGR00251 family)
MQCITSLQNNSLALDIHVQPRSSRNRVAGLHGSAVKVCVTAPPVDNKANAAVIKLLASFFGVPRSSLAIKSGSQGRSKRVLISNLDLQEARKRLSQALTDIEGTIP